MFSCCARIASVAGHRAAMLVHSSLYQNSCLTAHIRTLCESPPPIHACPAATEPAPHHHPGRVDIELVSVLACGYLVNRGLLQDSTSCGVRDHRIRLGCPSVSISLAPESHACTTCATANFCGLHGCRTQKPLHLPRGWLASIVRWMSSSHCDSVPIILYRISDDFVTR
jgi:hypothetical protein